MDDPKTVQCVTCGFLAKCDRHYSGPPPYFYEMPPKDRGTGEMSGIRLEAAREIYGFPQCYANAADLWGEIDSAIRGGTDRYAAAREAFNTERQCSKWHPYTPGFSPQEHWEEIRMLELELKRQEFEKRMADDQKTFMQTMATDQKAFMEKLDSGNKRVQLILGFVLGGNRYCRNHCWRASSYLSNWCSLAPKSLWHYTAAISNNPASTRGKIMMRSTGFLSSEASLPANA